MTKQLTEGQSPAKAGSELASLLRQIEDVSSLPDVALRVMETVRDPNTSGSDLKMAVEADPALTARMLRIVNSPFYGLKSKVTNVLQAISYLGFLETRNLAVSAVVAEIFRTEVKIGSYSRRDLWQHMVSVGVVSRVVATRFGVANFEDAFLAGVLHDLGIILMDQYLHARFVEVLEGMGPETKLITRERELLGFDHCEVGARVAETWGFADSVVQTIRHHHESANCQGEHRHLAQAVEVANFLCWAKKRSSIGAGTIDNPSKETLMDLAISRADLQALWEDLDEELANAETLIIG